MATRSEMLPHPQRFAQLSYQRSRLMQQTEIAAGLAASAAR
jgi:hypothetical protein